MPTLIIHDALRDKKVRLNLKDDATVARTIEILRGKYDHLKDVDLLISLNGTALEASWTLGRLVAEFEVHEGTIFELDERAGPREGASGEYDMADLDTIEAVTALEQQLERLAEHAGDLVSDSGEGEPAVNRSSRPFSLEDDVSSAAENRSDSGERAAKIALPRDPLETHDLLGEDELADEDDEEEVEEETMAGPPPAAVAAAREAAIERRATVRYHSRMIVGRSFPLLVVLSRREGSAERPLGPLAVAPILPGCLVIPGERLVDADSARAEAAFWVTPLSNEGLEESRLEIRQGTEILEIVPIPARASRRLGFHLLGGTGFALLGGAGLLAFWGGHLSEFARSLGGDVALGAGLGGLFVAAALVLGFVRRPRVAEPKSANLRLG